MTENTNEAIEENVTNSEVQEGATPEEANLTLNDLKTMFQVIQVCSTRAGAFRADEYETVGALYNKLFRFLDASGAIARQETEATADAEETNSEAEEAAE